MKRLFVFLILLIAFPTVVFASPQEVLFAKQQYTNGLNAYKAKNYQQCLQYLSNNYVKYFYGNQTSLYLAMGYSYFNLKQYEKAIPPLIKARELGLQDYSHDDYTTLYDVGLSYKFLGEQTGKIVPYSKKSYEFLATAFEKFPKDIAVSADLSDVCVNLNDNICVVNSVSRIVSINPRYSENAWKTLAQAYLNLDNVDKALLVWENGLEYYPTDLDMLYNYCNILLNINPMMYNSQIVQEYAGRMVSVAPRDERTLAIQDKLFMCAMQDPANPMSPQYQMEEEMRNQQMQQSMPTAEIPIGMGF